VAEIRIPSARAFRERQRCRLEGILTELMEHKVVQTLQALAAS
jgi:hypothetical protein